MKFYIRKNTIPLPFNTGARFNYLLLFFIAAYMAALPMHTLASGNTKTIQAITDNTRLAAPGDVLPMKLLGFTGTVSKDVVWLKWTTASEKNINHFEAEKSTNGTDFSSINRQIAVGVNTSPEHYQAEDFKPVAGINYYRLKIVGNDNQVAYTKIITVKFK